MTGDPSNSTIDDLVTVRDWLRYGISRFNAADIVYGHGTANATDESAFLILKALHLPIDELEPWLDARLTRPEREAVRELIERGVVEAWFQKPWTDALVEAIRGYEG
jgi:ribosomal protein L3 glutamine methyltransferase